MMTYDKALRELEQKQRFWGKVAIMEVKNTENIKIKN